MQNPEFLRKKYDLHQDDAVKKSVARKEQFNGEKVSGDPNVKIQVFLDRLAMVFTPSRPEGNERSKDFERKDRALHLMKLFMHKALIVKPDVATSEYIKHQKTRARQEGHGDIVVPQSMEDKIGRAVESILNGSDMRQELADFLNEEKQMAEEIVTKIEEQKKTLDYWMNYLTSPDADYPDWFKYWAIRSVIGLSSYDKDEKRFSSRDENTVNPFPDLNQQALANVLDIVEKDVEYKQKVKASKAEMERAKKKHDKGIKTAVAKKIAEIKKADPNAKIDRARREQIARDIEIEPFDESAFETAIPESPETPEELQQALDAQDFAKLYAWALEKITPVNERLLENIRGEWIKYKQGSGHMPLVHSIQDYATGWCTAGETTAESQLSRGDFYVYYSEDENRKNKIPRVAIRMEQDEIAEVRGIAKDQNTDSYIGEVVKEKMKDFPDGKEYIKKADDMNRMTEIEKKVIRGQKLEREDLRFLYEIDRPIEGFGYKKDPRIQELLDQRDPLKDALIVFDCQPNQIAHSQAEVNKNTKAYIGSLFYDFFNKIPKSVEHIYTKFPEKQVWHKKLTIDYDKSLAQHVKDGDYDWVDEKIEKFTIEGEGQEKQELVLVSIDHLMSTSEVEAEISRLGLLLPEIVDFLAVGVQYPELQRNNQIIALLKEGSCVRDSDGDVVVPVFYEGEDDDERWLCLSRYDDQWNYHNRFLARRK